MQGPKPPSQSRPAPSTSPTSQTAPRTLDNEISSKVNLSHNIDFEASCGTILVTLPSIFGGGGETLVVPRVINPDASMQGPEPPSRLRRAPSTSPTSPTTPRTMDYDLSLKVNVPCIIKCEVSCGALLVTLPPKYGGGRNPGSPPSGSFLALALQLTENINVETVMQGPKPPSPSQRALSTSPTFQRRRRPPKPQTPKP